VRIGNSFIVGKSSQATFTQYHAFIIFAISNFYRFFTVCECFVISFSSTMSRKFVTLVGLSPEVAQTIVSMGIAFDDLKVYAALQAAVTAALKRSYRQLG
jgi:hypothetical protein